MLTNNRNPRFSYIRRLVVLPLLGIVVVLFAFRNKEEKVLTLSVASVVEKAVEKGKQLIAVEDMPLDRVAKRDTITIEADTVYIHGKDKEDVVKIVPVNSANSADRPLIILDGKKVPYNVMSTLDPNLIKSVDVLKGNPAVSTMYGEEGKNGIVLITTKEFAKTKPLMILDGKKTDSAVLQIMDPNLIESVNVLKNEAATALYGDEGRNGVVMINTKESTPASLHLFPKVNISQHREGVEMAQVGWRDKNGNWIMPPRKVGVEGRENPALAETLLSDKVLTIVDGQKAASNILHTLDPNSISVISVLKDSTATALYGAEGKDGVIVITTKAYAEAYKKENPPKPTYEGYPLFTQTQTPAHFPGGEEAWQKYLQRNLNRDMIVEKGGPPGKYTVEVTFIVDKEGNLSDIRAENDPGYGTKEEAVRMIKKGPRWVPAEQNGKKVIYKHKQKITWVVSEPGIDIKKDKTHKSVTDNIQKTLQERMVKISQEREKTLETLRNNARKTLQKKILEKKRSPDEEIAFRVMAAKAASGNDKIFYMVDGSPCLLWDNTGVNWSRIDGTFDFAIIVDGKKISSQQLNKKYKRTDFQASLTRNSKKYGKMVFFLSTKPVTPEEVNSYLN